MTTYPQKNRRVVITRFGGPEVLRVVEEELPEPKRGQVRVRNLVAGVSFADLLMREGVHPEAWLRRPPFSPGWDLLGVVDKAGEGVPSTRTGQVVAALPVVGGYAGYICLPESELIPVPPDLDPGEAVSLVLNYATAYQMLHRSAHAAPRERALIHNAAGGIGTALLQLGKLSDLEMYGTASARKHDLVSSLGGSPIDYRTSDFVAEVFKRTGDGVDLVFDGLGGKNLLRSRKTLRRGGRLVAYGLTSTLKSGRRIPSQAATTIRDWVAAFALNLFPDQRKISLYSVQTLKRHRPQWFFEDVAALMGLLEQRRIKPLIAERVPLSQVARAHELLGAGRVIGKIVLICSPDGSA